MKWKKLLKTVGVFVGKAIINAVIEKGEKVVTEKKDARTAPPTTPSQTGGQA